MANECNIATLHWKHPLCPNWPVSAHLYWSQLPTLSYSVLQMLNSMPRKYCLVILLPALLQRTASSSQLSSSQTLYNTNHNLSRYCTTSYGLCFVALRNSVLHYYSLVIWYYWLLIYGILIIVYLYALYFGYEPVELQEVRISLLCCQNIWQLKTLWLLTYPWTMEVVQCEITLKSYQACQISFPEGHCWTRDFTIIGKFNSWFYYD